LYNKLEMLVLYLTCQLDDLFYEPKGLFPAVGYRACTVAGDRTKVLVNAFTQVLIRKMEKMFRGI